MEAGCIHLFAKTFSCWSNNGSFFFPFLVCDKQPIVCVTNTNSSAEANATSNNQCDREKAVDKALSISGWFVLFTITAKLALRRSTLPRYIEWSVSVVHWQLLVCVCPASVCVCVLKCMLEKQCLFTVNKVLEFGCFQQTHNERLEKAAEMEVYDMFETEIMMVMMFDDVTTCSDEWKGGWQWFEIFFSSIKSPEITKL